MRNKVIESIQDSFTLVVTVGIVPVVVVVDGVVVLDRLGFQISNCQNAGFVIGADSASIFDNKILTICVY